MPEPFGRGMAGIGTGARLPMADRHLQQHRGHRPGLPFGRFHQRLRSARHLTRATMCAVIRYMSNTRTNNVQHFTAMFGALSNPNRLRVFLRLLSCCGPEAAGLTDDQATAFVGELGRDLGIAASTVSHHIKELHRSGLIQMERRGQRVACWVDRGTLRELAEFFSLQVGQQQSCFCQQGREVSDHRNEGKR